MSTNSVCIIGAGLSGLITAYELKKRGIEFRILEARNRAGGRIHTLRLPGQASVEMGATWLGKQHRNLMDLLRELQLETVPQHMGSTAYYEPMSVSPPQLVELPPNDEPSYRIAGGTDALISALIDQLQPIPIQYDSPVRSVTQTGDSLLIKTDTHSVEAAAVCCTLPPRLLATALRFEPELPGTLADVASQTHTWMGESIKVAVCYEHPFWLQADSSGTLFSNVGPVTELYDHSGGGKFALKGFMNSAYHAVSAAQRRSLVLDQLRRIYGDVADACTDYHEQAWSNEPLTYTPYDRPVIPHQHNGHPELRKPIFSGRFLLSGSETASVYPGYMEGAVHRAREVATFIENLIS